MAASARSTQTQAEQQTVGAPAWPVTAGSLRALGLDLMGRPPLAQERARWIGRSMDAVVQDLLASPEFWSHWYEEQLYYFLLIDNFRPVGDSFDRLPGELASGALDVRTAIHRIALSPSFDLRNPGADTFVTVVMEQLAGLEVQKHAGELEVGKRVYDGSTGLFLGTTAASQSDLVKVVIRHKHFASTYLAREYERVVHAAPSKSELAQWVQAFQRDPLSYKAQLQAWLVSPGYRARLQRRVALSNRLFVRALFVDVRGALPAQEEERRIGTALDGLADPLPLRSVLARMVVDATGEDARPGPPTGQKEREAWLRNQFLQFLGREPSAGEFEAFLGALADPNARRETMDYALLSHPDYHTY